MPRKSYLQGYITGYREVTRLGPLDHLQTTRRWREGYEDGKVDAKDDREHAERHGVGIDGGSAGRAY